MAALILLIVFAQTIFIVSMRRRHQALGSEAPAKSGYRCVSSSRLAYSVGGRPTRARVRTL
jgi:hypothetical protein